MADETKYDGGGKYSDAIYADDDTRAPASAAEIAQRLANKAKHSERVTHGGKPGSGSKR